MKKLLPILLCLTLLTGCSGGSVYSNYRELEQLTVIQTMGLDALSDGVLLSAASGTDGSEKKVSRFSAAAPTVTAAREKLRDYCTDGQLFFAHTSFIAVGEQTARAGLMPYLDYVARVSDLRLCVPMLVVSGATAESLVTGASDCTGALRSIEENSRTRGDCILFSAADVIAALDANGCALMTAVKPAEAAEVVRDAKAGELTALPDGYAVLKDGAMIGRISADDALGVGLLAGRAGPAAIGLKVGDAALTVQLDDCSCELSPVVENGAVTAIDVSVKISTALTELDGTADKAETEAALAARIRGLVLSVLGTAGALHCDFLQLGAVLERQYPKECRGFARELSRMSLHYNVYVDAAVDRSFDLSLPD